MAAEFGPPKNTRIFPITPEELAQGPNLSYLLPAEQQHLAELALKLTARPRQLRGIEQKLHPISISSKAIGFRSDDGLLALRNFTYGNIRLEPERRINMLPYQAAPDGESSFFMTPNYTSTDWPEDLARPRFKKDQAGRARVFNGLLDHHEPLYGRVGFSTYLLGMANTVLGRKWDRDFVLFCNQAYRDEETDGDLEISLQYITNELDQGRSYYTGDITRFQALNKRDFPALNYYLGKLTGAFGLTLENSRNWFLNHLKKNYSYRSSVTIGFNAGILRNADQVVTSATPSENTKRSRHLTHGINELVMVVNNGVINLAHGKHIEDIAIAPGSFESWLFEQVGIFSTSIKLK